MPAQRTALLAAMESIAQDLRKSASDSVHDGGPTTHPVNSVDDGTTAVTEGSRSKENESDVKKQVGGDNIQVAEGQSQDSDLLSKVQSTGGGLSAKPTGEDPASEDAYKANLKDPGTTQPASVDNNEKYAKATYADNVKTAAELGNAILAAIVAPAAVKSAAAAPTVPTEQPAKPAVAATTTQKDASASAEDIVTATIRDAVAQADLLGEYLCQYKAAAEGAEPPPEAPVEDPSQGSPAAGGQPPIAEAGGPPPEAGGGEMPVDPAAMGGGGAPMPPAGMPSADPAMGGDPSGGAATQDEALQQLVAGLAEMGITPEMLAQAAAQAQPDPAGAMPAKQAYVAGQCLEFMRSGKYRIEATKSARERELRDAAKVYAKQMFKV